eukprot:TRINITY_DN25970_c0_g1_i1.p1 TRINITY_DN25970_c0_g1~~TRINITY_DN25970_c0_g1_i1.p1  ORF type:complete len:239 (-),score=62.39 TRINITY_DN25970_c0_g1_i1:12-728(-)
MARNEHMKHKVKSEIFGSKKKGKEQDSLPFGRRAKSQKDLAAQTKQKNAPLEVSSKFKTPKRLLDTYMGGNNASQSSSAQSKFKYRDPRFNALSGRLNPESYKENYAFLNQYKTEEVRNLKKALKNAKNPNRIAAIESRMEILNHQLRSDQQNEQKLLREREWKRQERAKVAEGKNPYYLKRKERKNISLGTREKYEQLKESGQLDSYLNKKRKRKSQKEHKQIPWERRSAKRPRTSL